MQESMNIKKFFENIFGSMNSGKSKSISGGNFFIGDGIIRWDNFFVPLSHVEHVAKYREQKEISKSAVLLMIFGGIMLFFSLIMLELVFMGASINMFLYPLAFGVSLLAAGIVVIYFDIHKKRPYYVKIRMGSGAQFLIESLNEGFVDEIIDVMEKCIKNKDAIYYIMVNSGIIQNGGDNSKMSINTDSFAAKQAINRREIKDLNEISGEEWTKLGKFLIRRIDDFVLGQKEYKLIERLMVSVGNREKENVKNQIKSMTREMVSKVFGKANSKSEKEEIVNILKKIIK